MRVKVEEKPKATTVRIETPRVRYEGAEVLEILEKNSNACHCKMSDGTTKWIPLARFEEKSIEE